MNDHVTITLRLRSPLCIARRPTSPGQPTLTRPYITGTALRGALASAWLRGRRYDTEGELNNTERAAFDELFLSRRLTFLNCLPHEDGRRTEVIPHTAWTSKDNGGWRNDEPPRQGVHDVLRSLLTGPPPDSGLERLGQLFASTSRHDQLEYRRVEPLRRLITRTAVDPRRGAAQEAQLFTLEALEAGQLFRGAIEGERALLDTLLASGVLQRAAPLSVGQGRSRGLGDVLIVDVSQPRLRVTRREEALAHVALFNEQLGRSSEQPQVLPVTVVAEAILRDQYLLPSSDAAPAQTLARYQHLPEPLRSQMRIERQGVMQTSAWIGGWDELRRLPHPPALALQMGSVWSFTVPAALIAEAVDWWLVAEQSGLGERRGEGFGRVRLCHPLHLTEGLV